MNTWEYIKIYNTKTKKLEIFTPLNPPRVTIYTCGPTVYDEPHIGNFRSFVFADTLQKTLRQNRYQVKHIINITDVGHLTDDADAGEDKIEAATKKEFKTAKEITDHYQDSFFNGLDALLIPRKHYTFPRATSYIQEQIDLIQKIERKGYTYTIPDGVYFDTKAYKEYGALGLPTSASENTHARIADIQGKKHFQDFALWKLTPEGTTRQQEWNSPWGRGFPGWHIECSAMAMNLLGPHIDIHTGGIDHIPVHHNNEIAQSESVTGHTFATLWMHNEFLVMQGEKLAKSKGNSFTLSTLEEKGLHPLALKLLFLQAHYRSQLSFSFESLQSAQTALFRLNSAYYALPSFSWSIFFRIISPTMQNYIEEIDAAMADDLHTPKVIATMYAVLSDDSISPSSKRYILSHANTYLGIFSKDCVEQEKTATKNIPPEVIALLKKRDAARKEKRYEESDALRIQIEKLGYTVKDTDQGSFIE